MSRPKKRKVAAPPAGKPLAVGGGGAWGSFYEATAYSTARAYKPFFATDSKHTLTTFNRTRAMSLARWAYVNIPVLKAGVDLMARLTVGTGFEPRTPGPVGKLYDAYYLARTRAIGFMAGESMDELLLHDCRAVDVDGDLGYVMTEDETGAAKLQVIEGHRIITGDTTDERCIDGIWVDAFGRKAGYNVALPGGKTVRLAPQDFLYLAERNRPDELRSMTNFVHALAPLQDLYEILGFAMTSAKKNTEIAAIIETQTPNDLPLGAPRGMTVRGAIAATVDQPAQPAVSVTYEQVTGGGGKIPILRPGETFKSFAHAQPSPTIAEWSDFHLRGIFAGYGLPFEIVLKPELLGGASYRGVLGILRQRLQQRRASLVYPKLTRTRFWILSRGVARGDIPYDPAISQVQWQPKFVDITVDAGRESRERRANVLGGLDTFTSYDAENGNDYLGTSLPAREVEMDAQCAAALRLSAKYPGLSFEAALARIALLTAGASEVTAATQSNIAATVAASAQ